MRFALASYGTRGDVEPYVAVGRELLQRGHHVRMAVAPDQVDFARAAGLDAVSYGPDTRRWQAVHRDFLARLTRNTWRVRELGALGREDWALIKQFWDEATDTMTALVADADVLFTSLLGEEVATNVAERAGIPLATMHFFPVRPNGQAVPASLARVARAAMTFSQWLVWPLTKRLEDAQRRQFGLPKASTPSPHRIAARGSLEVQAYDAACVPGLAAEWANFEQRRPFVGALTMELPGDADDVVATWIDGGTPPIFFGFGSMPVKSAADTLAMISAVCAELDERALVCAGSSDFGAVTPPEHVKVVGTLDYAATFPRCRALVHHGGVGTTAAGLRAGVPAVVLPTWADQKLWAARVKRLKVGTARPFSKTTATTLSADLRSVLTPEYVRRARDLATRMTTPAESVTSTADLVEALARRGQVD